MKISSGKCDLTIDDRTGSIVSIKNNANGSCHLNSDSDGRNDGRLFRLMIPASQLGAGYIDSQEQAPPKITIADTTKMIWGNLKCHDGTISGISAIVEISKNVEEDEVRFSLTLRNNGDGDITDIAFPIISGWTKQDGPGKDVMVLGGRTILDPHSFPRPPKTTYVRINQRDSYRYPNHLCAPWVDFSSSSGGITYINYFAQPENGMVYIENLAGYEPGLRLAYGWVCPTVVKSGDDYQSSAIGISVHQGDWHASADRYLRWAESWFTPQPTNHRLARSIGFQNVWLRNFSGSQVHPLSAIPDLAAAGRQYAVNDLCVWDYLMEGNFTKRTPEDMLDFSDEEARVVSEGVKEADADGTHLSAVVNFKHYNRIFKDYNLWEPEAAKDYYGNPRIEEWGISETHPCVLTNHLGPISTVMSALSVKWREKILKKVEQFMALGFKSMFYDQPSTIFPDYGFMEEGHRPESAYNGYLTLLSEIRRRLQAKNSDAYMIGEHPEIFMSQNIDLWMAWGTDLGEGIRKAYSIPYTRISWVVDSSVHLASHAFACGFNLCLTTHGMEETLAKVPALGEHIAKLAALRLKTAERTTMARFRDQCGLRIESTDGLLAYMFESEDGAAVTLCAGEKGSQGTVSLEFKQSDMRDGETTGVLFRINGGEERIEGDSLIVDLAPDEVAVWYIECEALFDYSKMPSLDAMGTTSSPTADLELF